MRDDMVSTGNWAAGVGSAITTGAEVGNESLESEGFAAVDDFNDEGLTTGFEIDVVGASGAGVWTAAASGVDPALREMEDCTAARSGAATVDLDTAAEDDDVSEGTCAPTVEGAALAESTLDASRMGTQRAFSAAIVSRSSFSV